MTPFPCVPPGTPRAVRATGTGKSPADPRRTSTFVRRRFPSRLCRPRRGSSASTRGVSGRRRPRRPTSSSAPPRPTPVRARPRRNRPRNRPRPPQLGDEERRHVLARRLQLRRRRHDRRARVRTSDRRGKRVPPVGERDPRLAARRGGALRVGVLVPRRLVQKAVRAVPQHADRARRGVHGGGGDVGDGARRDVRVESAGELEQSDATHMRERCEIETG